MKEKDFIFAKSKDLQLSGIKNFPVDFTSSKQFNVIDVPPKVLILGREFFGLFEVSTTTGDFAMTFNNEIEAKYIVYASKNRQSIIQIPKDLQFIKAAVDSYEKYLDNILQEIRKEYEARFHNGKNFTLVSNEIFKKLNLTRL